jgi:hypothetical protein
VDVVDEGDMLEALPDVAVLLQIRQKTASRTGVFEEVHPAS